MKKLLIDANATLENLPSFEWCTKDKPRTQAHDFVNSHFNEQFELIDTLRNKPTTLAEKVRIGFHYGEFITGFSEDSYPKRKALETIKDCFEVLTELGLLD